MKNAKILILDDNSIIALALKTQLESHGYNDISVVSTGEQAVEIAKHWQPNIIFADIQLNGSIDGIEAVSQIRTRQEISVIYITGDVDLKHDQRLIATKPAATIEKPYDNLIVMQALKNVIQ
ncbi:hypothetical protein B6I21_03890 [candidate division KSB1 bacterium 4572_119]|nr:MAG: hypothetical protein B6I21_03890 [candidate division KSB1 bacterium 4572_119]